MAPHTRARAEQDLRYVGQPDTKRCPTCKVERVKYDFYAHRDGFYKATGKPRISLSSECRYCYSARAQRRRDAAGKKLIPTREILPRLLALYGKHGTFDALAKDVGLVPTALMALVQRPHGKIRASNFLKINRAFTRMLKAHGEERVREWHQIGLAKHVENETRRRIRQSDDRNLGMRTCIHCKKQKFVEEFGQTSQNGKRYKPHRCLDCRHERRAQLRNSDPGDRLVRVTPTLAARVERLVAHYGRMGLHERQIWDSTWKRVLSGQAKSIRVRMLDRIVAAENELL